MKKNPDKMKWLLWLPGLAAGVLGTLCCTGPVVSVLLGLGGASILLGLDQFRPVLISLGILVLAGASWYAVQHRRTCCAKRSRVKETLLIAIVFSTGIFAYAALQYGIVPLLSQSARQKITAESHAEVFQQTESIESLTLEIGGMTCEGCAVGMQKRFTDLPGVFAADVDWRAGKAEIRYDNSLIQPKQILESIDLPSPYTLKIQNQTN